MTNIVDTLQKSHKTSFLASTTRLAAEGCFNNFIRSPKEPIVLRFIPNIRDTLSRWHMDNADKKKTYHLYDSGPSFDMR